jgi:excisionase family DNA binding protein
VTTTEVAKALGYANTTYVERLLRAGTLRGTKDERGRWVVTAESVDAYRRRVEFKRSSTSNRVGERARRKAEAAARFA